MSVRRVRPTQSTRRWIARYSEIREKAKAKVRIRKVLRDHPLREIHLRGPHLRQHHISGQADIRAIRLAAAAIRGWITVWMM